MRQQERRFNLKVYTMTRGRDGKVDAYKSEHHVTFETYSQPFSRHQSLELVV